MAVRIRWKLIGQIALIAVPVMSAVCVVLALALQRMRENAIADAQRTNDTMASILSQQVFQSVQAIDLVLDDLVARAAAPEIATDGDLRRKLGTKGAHRFLLGLLGHLPHADVISVADRHGRFIASTRAWPTVQVDISGHNPFEYLKRHRDPSLFIGVRQIALTTGHPIIYFSRRLENRKGDFLGTAAVGVRPKFFLRLYDGISAVPGASVRLLRPDGTILVSYPGPATGKTFSEVGRWRALVEKGGGHFRTASGPFGRRLMAVQPVKGYPLVVNAGVGEANVLALWRARATVVGLGGLAFALVVTTLICFLFLLYRKAVAGRLRFAAQSKELLTANLRFDSLLTNMKQGVAMFDRQDRIVIHNRSFAEMYGLSGEEMAPGTSLATIIDLRLARGIPGTADCEECRHRHADHFKAGANAQHSMLEHLCDGRYILVSHQPMPGGGWITTHEDVTARHQAAVQIVHMARHDALTGLGNRTLFLECVRTALHGGDACFAALLVDLDEFKAVNDTFGHAVGDALLVAVAARLGEAIGHDDIVARLGGDEFAILQRLAGPDVGPAAALAVRLLTRIREPYHVEGREVKIGLSIGIAATTYATAIEPSTLMRNADLALYRAKADGRNCYRVFDPAMAEEIQSRRELAIALDAALATGQLSVHYQPIVDAQTLDTVGMEALVRWHHPARGNIVPDIFIPLAEEAGLISRVGVFVLETACRDALAWPSSITVSVNVSPLQVTRSDLVEAIRQVLVRTGLPAQRLQIEITESVLLGDDDHNLAVLQELRETGITIVLDDFGTGFSSLGYLNHFPLDKLKIDRSFIERLGTDAGSAAIVAAVTSIAHAFEAVTTAEGVETEEQYRLLRTTAVAEMQGFLFGVPMPAEAWRFRGLKAVIEAPEFADAAAA